MKTIYKINGKEYKLTDNNHVRPRKGISDLRPNDNPDPVLIALKSEDEDLIIIYLDDCEGLRAELRHDYKNGAAIDPDCDGEQYASDNMPEYCEMPDLDDPDQYDALRAEVYEMTTEQYQDFYANLLDDLKEEEEEPAQFTLGVAQDYGVPCLIARSGDERHTLIVNIYKVVRDPNYNRDAVKAECKECFNLPNCVYDEDQLDYLLSEIEDKISEENEAAN